MSKLVDFFVIYIYNLLQVGIIVGLFDFDLVSAIKADGIAVIAIGIGS